MTRPPGRKLDATRPAMTCRDATVDPHWDLSRPRVRPWLSPRTSPADRMHDEALAESSGVFPVRQKLGQETPPRPRRGEQVRDENHTRSGGGVGGAKTRGI